MLTAAPQFRPAIIVRIATALALFSIVAIPAMEAQAQTLSSSAFGSQKTILVTAPGNEANVEINLSAQDIAHMGIPDLIGALARDIPGLSLSNAQSNSYQPNLVYHGFVASPLQGNAQGLAFYVDGARFNQSFGDTVDFDLLPEAAIDRVDIRTASPVYGLNALGGAVVVRTKTGRTAPGVLLSAAGGDHGRADGILEAGASRGPWSGYIALEGHHDGGWRRHSPSRLYNGFADLGYDGGGGGIHLKLMGAKSDLTGNGSAPVELLAADPRAVFTYPDNTGNHFGRISLHPWLSLSDSTRVEASLYDQHLLQHSVNGDAADVEACESAADAGLLCLESANDAAPAAILRDTHGQAIADSLGGDGYGVLNHTTTRSDAAGLLVQLVDHRPLLGGENRLVLGVSHDRSHNDFMASTELGALTPERSVSGLGPVIDQIGGTITPVSVIARTRYTGIFATEDLPLAHGLSAQLGLRWNEARILLDDQIGTALNGRHRFTRLNPGAALIYVAGPGLKIQLGYSQANRAPTPAELACADPQAPCSLTNFFVGDPPLRQVTAASWQASVSGQHDGDWGLKWRLAAYRTISRDDIQYIASDTRGRAYFQNIGDTRRQGVDANITLTYGRWSVRAGYAFTDAVFLTPLILSSPDNPSANDDGQIAVIPGDRLPGIPRHRGVLSVDYNGDGFALGGDVQAQSGQVLFGDESNQRPPTNGFVTLALHASTHLAGPFVLFGEVSNLFNDTYASFGTFSETDEVDLVEAPGASNPRSLSPGAPRRWRMGLRARF